MPGDESYYYTTDSLRVPYCYVFDCLERVLPLTRNISARQRHGNDVLELLRHGTGLGIVVLLALVPLAGTHRLPTLVHQ